MVRSHDRRKREIEYDTDYSSNLARFECIDTHPELFDRLYPNVSVYTPYTLYPTTQSWMTQGTLDPTATYPWVEKSGPDSGDVNEWDANLDPLEKSVSREMAKQTEIDPVEYQEWLDWQRNRSLEDENQYENITYTCRMPGCTFNHSDDVEVGDHIFIHHFTYPTNYKEEMTYRIESSTLGWERLTDVNYLLNRYSDEALHPDIREDFDIFTGLFDNLNFPTIHPNHTLPSKKKRTKFVPTTDPLMETIPITKPKKTTNHHEHAEKHGHHTAKGDHHTGKHDHHSTKHDHLADAGDGHHKRHRRDLGVGHKRQRRDHDSLPPMPKDSNERSGPDGRRYYPSPESRERRHRRALKADEALHAGHHKRHRRDYDSLPPMPKDSNERSGPDGRRYYPSPESRERRHHRDYDSLPSKPKDSNERSGPNGRRYYPSPESRERRHHRDYDSLPSKPKDSNERSGSDGRRYYPSPESRERHRRDLDSIPPLPSPSTNELLDSYGGPAFLKTGEELSDLTPAPTGTTVFDLLPLYSNYEPEKETRWKFSEETVPPKFRCKYCGDLFHEEDHLIHHKSSVHPRLRTPTTTPKFRIMKNFFTLDSEVDMSKNYDFVFSEPDNGSFVQHRPILEDSFYKSFNPDAPEHNVNPESYAAIDEYMDEVFNKSTHSICNACGKNISHRSAEAHFRKHVSRIKKDYFDELPPEYMDRCFKEAYWDDSWETIHHKLRRQYEENRIVQSIFEPETYKCKRCNATFRNHELTYAHLLEHKKNASIISAREAEIRNQIKRVKHKRSVDCIEIDNPGTGDNKTVPLYKIYESFNTSKERIENITPGRIPNIFTVDIPKESIGKSNSDAKNLNKVADDYNERSISENLESRVQERYARQKEADTEIDQQTVSKSGIGEEDPEKVSQNTNGVNKDTNGVNKDMDGANKDINGVNNDMNPPPEAHEEIPEIPDYYLNVNEDNEEDNHSEEEESDSDSSDEDSDGRKTTRNSKSGQDGSSLENFIAKVKREFNTITTQDILGNQSILLTRIEKMFADNQRHRKAFFRRFRRQVEVTDDDEIDRRVLAERWNSTECNIVEKLEKRFSTKLVDKGHKFLETDVSRLLEDFGIAKNPNVTSEENRMRERSFRECMRIIDARETRSDQNYHVQYDEHMDYMRLRNETATLSPSEEVMWRSKPRNEYSDYEELMSDKWTCYECNKTYDNYTAFLMHMKKPKEPKSPYLIDLENKERKERMENIFTTKSYWVNECFECGAKFNTRQELLDHINDKGYESLPHIDRVDQTVKCVHCDLAFTNVQKYLEHKVALREAEILLGNQTNKVFCGDCKKYFDTYDDYHDHLTRERITDYEEMPKYICPVCNFTYLDSISLGLHMKKIHPEEDAKRVRKRRSCRIENAETVHVVAHHLDYNVMKHFVLETVNAGRRKKRNVEYKKKQKRSRRKKRDLMMLKRNKAVRNNKREGMEHSIKKRQVNVENTHNGKDHIKKRQVNIENKHNLKKRQVDTQNKVDNEVNKPRREIINKRKRRDVDTLMDKMDKEYEKYHMFNWNPDFNIKDPILMHDKYREYYFQGLAEHEKHNLQLQNEQAQRDLIGSQAGQELMAPGDKELRGPGQNLEGVEGTYAYGPALFGTTWSYKLWPTIRYNIMAPGKSYNNTQYFHRYYQNQTIKNHIKAIFRDYFIKPLNATWPVRQFRESERDTEELESLARKDRRKRTAEDVSDEGIEKDLDDNDDVANENQIGGNRNKRHVVDRACFYDQIRERPKIAKKIDKKCGCKNKFNEVQAPLETHIEIKANDIINVNNIAKGDNELANEGESINNANGDNIVDTVHIAKRSNIAQGDNFIDPDNKGEAIHIANRDNIVDTVHNTKRNNIAVNNITNENIVNPNNGGSVNIANENIVHANLGDVEMKKVRVRSPKPTSPKPPRPKRTKPDEYDDVEDINKEVTILDAVLPESPVAQPAVACGCHAPRVRRQLRIDVNNNNTIRKVNWEKLAKILVHENRNLSKLLDKYVTRRTTPIRKYECRHCGERLPDLQPYLEHMVQHEKEFELEQSYSEEFNITCNHCYQIFSTEDAIHEHNLERMRILREREHADYVELNRTTRRKIYTPFEDPFTIKIMENEDNTFWNPPEVTETEDPAEDRYYCYYCKDMMANTKEFIEHRKFHETSRKQAKEAYLARREKIKEKAKKDFSLESLADM
ncbi:hypothetical protein M8J75_004798 [Diaphorina citri]|nr:hypothetical protein M8J75_004798 [Diaphorina citri]